MMTLDREAPGEHGPPKNPLELPIGDPTGMPIEDLMRIYDVPRETAELLADPSLVDDAWIARTSARQPQTMRKWRRERTKDLKAGNDPNVNPNAMIAAEPARQGVDPDVEPLRLGQSVGYKQGRVILWLIATLRFNAYTRQPVNHKSYGRQVGAGGTPTGD